MDNLVQFLTLQRVEDDHVVNSIQKLGGKGFLEGALNNCRAFFFPGFHLAWRGKTYTGAKIL